MIGGTVIRRKDDVHRLHVPVAADFLEEYEGLTSFPIDDPTKCTFREDNAADSLPCRESRDRCVIGILGDSVCIAFDLIVQDLRNIDGMAIILVMEVDHFESGREVRFP